MSDDKALFEVGDVITVNGWYADGTCEENDTPTSQYRRAQLQLWRVRTITAEGHVELEPIKDRDEKFEAFLDVIGFGANV